MWVTTAPPKNPVSKRAPNPAVRGIRNKAVHVSSRIAIGVMAVRGKARCSRSGKNLPVGRPRRVFDHERALALRNAGKSIREIARILGIGKGTAERILGLSHKPNLPTKKPH